MILFDPSLLGLFGLAAYSSLNDSIWSLDSYSCYFDIFLLHYLWAPLSHLFLLRHPWPICFSWESLALFLILRSYGLLLTFLGFSGPITLSFILGAHGLSINPLLSLLALLQACCSPFSFFYITYCPWICYFSLRAPLGPFSSSRPSCLFYGPIIHYSYHFNLMVFSVHSLTLLCPYCWASSFYQASQNEHQHLEQETDISLPKFRKNPIRF